mgnify:CR=1 FL=1
MTPLHQKYQKVKTLAERGATEGERQAARAAIARMEEAHPELLNGAPKQHSIFGLDEEMERLREDFIRNVFSKSWDGDNTSSTAASSRKIFVFYL